MQTHLPRALRAFGLNVRKQREASGLTQERAGEKANLDPTYISGIERGVRNPSLLSICRIAKALGVSASELVQGVRE
ncbi:MAG: helix-turn-helix transcriptional regulator [Blastocatellia bacterium]|nr:helix-turn-helix transcriptional regulator [Blastocatellia bacterium]